MTPRLRGEVDRILQAGTEKVREQCSAKALLLSKIAGEINVYTEDQSSEQSSSVLLIGPLRLG